MNDPDVDTEEQQRSDTYVVFSHAPTPQPALSRDGGERPSPPSIALWIRSHP